MHLFHQSCSPPSRLQSSTLQFPACHHHRHRPIPQVPLAPPMYQLRCRSLRSRPRRRKATRPAPKLASLLSKIAHSHLQFQPSYFVSSWPLVNSPPLATSWRQSTKFRICTLLSGLGKLLLNFIRILKLGHYSAQCCSALSSSPPLATSRYSSSL